MNKKLRKIAIIADGEFPTHPVPLQKLSDADVVIACDGAVEELVAHGFKADYIVGDMDTLSPEKQQEYKDIIVRIAEQESNDLTKAFRFALDLLSKVTAADEESETAEINILAATGKREDHTIGNISLLADYQVLAMKSFDLHPHKSTYNIEIKAYTDYGAFAPYYSAENKPLVFKELDVLNDLTGYIEGRAVSIFAFDASLRITSYGLDYQTSGVTFDLWWKATLNRIAEEDASLCLSHSAAILLYFPY